MAALGPTASTAQDPLIPEVIERLEAAQGNSSWPSRRTALYEAAKELKTFGERNPGTLSDKVNGIVSAAIARREGSVATSGPEVTDTNIKDLLSELKKMVGGRRRPRRHGKKTRRGRRRGGADPEEAAKAVAQTVVSALDSVPFDPSDSGAHDVVVTLPTTPDNAAAVDALIQKLKAYKESNTFKGRVSSAVSGLTGKFGSLFGKSQQTAGATTEALEGYLTTLKNTGTVTITESSVDLDDLKERLKTVAGLSGGRRSRRSRQRRYTRRR